MCECVRASVCAFLTSEPHVSPYQKHGDCCLGRYVDNELNNLINIKVKQAI